MSCSTPPGTRLSIDNSLGSLRLQVQYTADHVFPAPIYESLKNLLLQSVQNNVSGFVDVFKHTSFVLFADCYYEYSLCFGGNSSQQNGSCTAFSKDFYAQ